MHFIPLNTLSNYVIKNMLGFKVLVVTADGAAVLVDRALDLRCTVIIYTYMRVMIRHRHIKLHYSFEHCSKSLPIILPKLPIILSIILKI